MSAVESKGPLKNQRHELFAQGIAAGKTADEAYAAAGYKPNRGNASTLKADQNISRRVTELLTKAAARVEIDQAWVLKQLVENVERAKQAVPVMVTIDGQSVESGEWKYEGNVVNKALELIGKHLGMFADKLEHSGKIEVASNLSDEQLGTEVARIMAQDPKAAEVFALAQKQGRPS